MRFIGGEAGGDDGDDSDKVDGEWDECGKDENVDDICFCCRGFLLKERNELLSS